MNNEIIILGSAAASMGFIHTLLGPDHYLPFVAMSRSGRWTLRKTVLVTLICGIGHVLSSVVLGFIGVAFGITVFKLETIESFRGDIAAWALLSFGLVYLIWGIRKAIRYQKHDHTHTHEDSVKHTHTHSHTHGHMHVHHAKEKKNFTPWMLFIIFVLGPCEPLIPLLMYPAVKQSFFALWLVTAIFGSITILTMLGTVLISIYGINLIPSGKIDRYAHAIAGAIISVCGISIIFLGL